MDERFKHGVLESLKAKVDVPYRGTRFMARIAVTDGMSKDAVALLEKSGHEVVLEFIKEKDLLAGALKDFEKFSRILVLD